VIFLVKDELCFQPKIPVPTIFFRIIVEKKPQAGNKFNNNWV